MSAPAHRLGEEEEEEDDEVEDEAATATTAPSEAIGPAGATDASAASARQPAHVLSGAILGTLRPQLESLSERLVELQEAQRMLVTTMTVQRAELTEGNSDWLAAKSVLDRIPGARAVVRLCLSYQCAGVVRGLSQFLHGQPRTQRHADAVHTLYAACSMAAYDLLPTLSHTHLCRVHCEGRAP